MRIAFYTLGCKVNQYETQALKEEFMRHGFDISDSDEEADIYVVNTCTVTGLADRKSRQYIRRVKKLNPESIVAAIGCYAQINPEAAAAITGVDLVVGNNEKTVLPEYIEDLLKEKQRGGVKEVCIRILKTEELTEYKECGSITSMESRTRAYIKIQDGCDQFCSYCIIPYARGPIRSRAPSEILKEAESLLGKGFKELVLTGINTALYGMERDFCGGKERHEYIRDVPGIEMIVRMLNELPGDFRIRLGSLEPTVVNAMLVKRLLKYDKLCHHMHLSLQSGSDKILKAMNRHYDRHDYLEIVKVLRDEDEHYGITTDVIAGFPGETEKDFKESIDLIKQVGFLKTHVFPYSDRQGTKARDMKDKVNPKIKKIRSAELTAISEASALNFLKSTIGIKRMVLFEEYDKDTGTASGFSDNYIKVYCQVTDEEQGLKILNTLEKVEFTDTFRDGIKGRLINLL